jgi:hypothetical protein
MDIKYLKKQYACLQLDPRPTREKLLIYFTDLKKTTFFCKFSERTDGASDLKVSFSWKSTLHSKRIKVWIRGTGGFFW